MWRWLTGPGSKLRYPRKDSTNYLGAYDKDGNLIRETMVRSSGADKQSDEGEEREDGALEGKKQEDADLAEGEEGAKVEASERNDKRRPKDETPVETVEDLRPFPLNPFFQSEAVLSEELRNEVYRRVVEQGQTVREVSIALHIEMARVGAVVRLKTIEQDWIRKNKPLAQHYQSAVLKMLPKTPFDPTTTRYPARHESINDLPVHAATLAQLWHPTSESRHFTRADAGRVFSAGLLPADARIPHPEMIETARDRIGGMRAEEQRRVQAERIARVEGEAREARERARRRVEARTKVVEGRRWDFKFMDVRVEDVGKDGRAGTGVGWRYGFPHEDRKKGQVKIPTRVD